MRNLFVLFALLTTLSSTASDRVRSVRGLDALNPFQRVNALLSFVTASSRPDQVKPFMQDYFPEAQADIVGEILEKQYSTVTLPIGSVLNLENVSIRTESGVVAVTCAVDMELCKQPVGTRVRMLASVFSAPVEPSGTLNYMLAYLMVPCTASASCDAPKPDFAMNGTVLSITEDRPRIIGGLLPRKGTVLIQSAGMIYQVLCSSDLVDQFQNAIGKQVQVDGRIAGFVVSDNLNPEMRLIATSVREK